MLLEVENVFFYLKYISVSLILLVFTAAIVEL